jgi:hypothetical protein
MKRSMSVPMSTAAERAGFEPADALASPVFKLGARRAWNVRRYTSACVETRAAIHSAMSVSMSGQESQLSRDVAERPQEAFGDG